MKQIRSFVGMDVPKTTISISVQKTAEAGVSITGTAFPVSDNLFEADSGLRA